MLLEKDVHASLVVARDAYFNINVSGWSFRASNLCGIDQTGEFKFIRSVRIGSLVQLVRGSYLWLFTPMVRFVPLGLAM